VSAVEHGVIREIVPADDQPTAVDKLSTAIYAEVMGKTTTIRVDVETHARLVELSQATGDSLTDTVRAAAEALRRQRFARTVAAELDQLRADPETWAAYLAEADGTAVADGIA
jgi:hypothetical protein